MRRLTPSSLDVLADSLGVFLLAVRKTRGKLLMVALPLEIIFALGVYLLSDGTSPSLGFGERYDLVLGPVANDNVYTTIGLSMKGFVSRESTIRELCVHKLYDEYIEKQGGEMPEREVA